MNEVLIHLRQAAHRGEIDAALFVRLCEVLLAQGQSAPVLAVLQERGMLPHLTTTAGAPSSSAPSSGPTRRAPARG
jgi:hypothetical protein